MKINNKRLIKKFDKDAFKFKEVFVKHFSKYKPKTLENLHNVLPNDLLPKKVVKVKNDQSQKIYKFLYKIDKGYELKKSNNSSNFLKLFDRFIYFLAKKIFKESLVYQSKPTLRIMFPNNKAVGDFHRDREYNHPLEEINIWVPITASKKTNSIWIESRFDKNDYKAMNLNYGEFLIFDSGLKHGNKINLENKTRLSFDFRVIPFSLWSKKNKNINKVSVDAKKAFKIGDYYKLMKI